MNDTDVDTGNDYLANVFTATPASVPTASGGVLVVLVLLLGSAGFVRARVRAGSSCRVRRSRKYPFESVLPPAPDDCRGSAL